MPDAPSQPPADPNRREVLAGMAGLAAVTLTPAGAAAGGWTPLLRASERLTGIPLDLSYLELAQTVWATLRRTYSEQKLDKLVRFVNAAPQGSDLTLVLERAAVLEVGQAMAKLWYTGAPADDTQPALFYNDALMWRSCDFTKPPATCGGPFGYWEYEPAGPGGTDRTERGSP